MRQPVAVSDNGIATGEHSASAIRWSAADGYLDLGFVHSPGYGANHATSMGDISSNGEIIVGTSITYYGDGVWLQHPQAFVWTASSGIQPLGSTTLTESWAKAVSADGRVVAGDIFPNPSSQHAAAWIDGVETLRLSQGTSAWAVSSNGAWIGGIDATTAETDAFIWSQATGLERIGSLGPAPDIVKAVSNDGTIAVGIGGDRTPFRWIRGVGMQSLGRLSPEAEGYATAMTLDGSVVVGSFGTEGAFIWTEEDGLRDLEDFLENEFSLDLTGWSLQAATDVSADGSTIVGYGLYQGSYRGFIATIPEPSSAILLMSGFAMLLRVRSGRRRS